jgi:glycogen debranching enzyme
LRLKENSMYLVADERGQVTGGETGLYVGDTRFVSHLEWRIGGEALTVLSTHSPEPFRFSQHATEPGLGVSQRLEVRRKGWLTGALYEETVRVRVFDDPNVPSPSQRRQLDLTKLELLLDADFSDMFEVRGLPRIRRDIAVTQLEDGFRYAYDGADSVRRELEVTVSPLGAVSRVTLKDALQSAPVTFDNDNHNLGVPLEDASTPRQGVSVLWTLPSEGTVEITVRVRPLLSDRTLRGVNRDALHSAYADWRAQSRVHVGNTLIQRVFDRSSEDLRALLFDTPQGAFPAAGIPWFCTPFGRDSVIVALMTLPWYPEVALGTLRYLAAHQGKVHNAKNLEAPGKILHEQRDGEASRTGRTPFQTYYGSVDATPLWVCLLADYLEWTGDLATVRALEPNLRAAMEWMASPDADPDGDGFIEYVPHVGGITNQVWKDSGDSVFFEDGSNLEAPIAVVEVQAYAYRALVGAGAIYRALGDAERATTFEARAAALKVQFAQAFWLEDLKTLAHALDARKRPARVIVSNAGHALWGGIVNDAQARDIAETLFGADAWSGWGVRTLAQGQPRFNPVSYHNGSVWPHDNALIALGLARYGLFEHVKKLARAQLEAAALVPDARLSELFAGFARESTPGLPASPPVPYPAACHPQAWDAAAPYAFLWAALGFTAHGRGAGAGLPEAWGAVEASVVRGAQTLEVT